MKLIPIEQHPDAARILYDLLASRPTEYSISHRAMPSWEDHRSFIDSHPYEAFYLIEVEGDVVGKIYLTYPPSAPSLPGNEIGIDLFPQHRGKGCGTQAVKMLMEMHGPRRYVANIAPANAPSQRMFKRLGFRLCQYSYASEAA